MNIDTELGLQAVRNTFSKYPESNRPDEEILHEEILSLTHNDFEFNAKYYLQIHGTAMGKNVAPACANLYKCIKLPTVYYRILDEILAFGLTQRNIFIYY